MLAAVNPSRRTAVISAGGPVIVAGSGNADNEHPQQIAVTTTAGEFYQSGRDASSDSALTADQPMTSRQTIRRKHGSAGNADYRFASKILMSRAPNAIGNVDKPEALQAVLSRRAPRMTPEYQTRERGRHRATQRVGRGD